MAERTDSGRLFQRERAHESNAHCACAGLDPRDQRVNAVFDISEWDGSDVASIE